MSDNGKDHIKMLKLEGRSNWIRWLFTLKAWCYKHGCRDILDGTETAPVREQGQSREDFQKLLDSYETRSKDLYYQLVLTQTESTLPVIQSCEPGESGKVYRLLCAEFASTSEHAIHQMVQELVTWKQHGRDLTTGIAELEKLKIDLKAAVVAQGKDIFDILAMFGMFQGVDSHLVMTADMARMSEKDWEAVKAIMKDADVRLRGKPGGDPLGTFKTTVPPAVDKTLIGSGGARNIDQRPCTFPGCPNPARHSERKCYLAHPELRPRTTAAVGTAVDSPAGKVASLWGLRVLASTRAVAPSSLAGDPAFIDFELDTANRAGCCVQSTHLISDIDRTRTVPLEMANGAIMRTEGTGKIAGKFDTVHISSEFSGNLLGMNALADQGMRLVLEPGPKGAVVGYIQHAASNGTKIGVRRDYDDAYRVRVSAPPVAASIPVKSHRHPQSYAEATKAAAGERVPDSDELLKIQRFLAPYHAKLNHCGNKALYEGVSNPTLFPHLMVPPGLTLLRACKYFSCGDDCKLAQLNRRSIYSLPARKHGINDWSFDIKGPYPTLSWNKNRYTGMLVNLKAGYLVTFHLKTKADALPALQAFEGQKLRRRGVTIDSMNFTPQTFLTDNGGETVSAAATAWFTKIGCEPRLTNAYSSASNGAAERAHQTIDKVALALMLAGDFPKAARDELIDSAVFVHNLMPKKRLGGLSPLQMVFPDVKFDLERLRVIGEKCYVATPKALLKTGDNRGIKGKVIGYSKKTNGWRVMTNNLTGGVEDTESITFLADRVHPLPSHVLTTTPRQYPINPNHKKDLYGAFADDDDDDDDVDDVPTATTSVPAVPAAPVVPVAPAPVAYGRHAVMVDEWDDADSGTVQDAIVNATMEVAAQESSTRPSRQGSRPDYKAMASGRSVRSLKCPLAMSSAEFDDFLAQTQRDLDERPRRPLRVSKVRLMTQEEAMANPKVVQSMETESQYLITERKAEAAYLPDGKDAIRSMWVHTVKPSTECGYKSRFCPFGCDQKPGADYDPKKVSSPVLSLEAMFLYFSLCVCMNLYTRAIDVNNAFCQTELNEDVYVHYPPGWKIPFVGAVLKLLCCIYGLKQSGYQFDRDMRDFMIVQNGFKESTMFPCLYYKWILSDLILVPAFVDDCRVSSTKPELTDAMIVKFNARWKCKDPGTAKWVGFGIEHDIKAGVLKLNQDEMILKLLGEHCMLDCNPCKTPAAPGTKLEKLVAGETEILNSNLEKIVGSCLWLSRGTVPELAYATSQVGSHVRHPGERHVNAGKRMLRYLKGRLGRSLILNRQGSLKLVMVSDADFAGEPEVNLNPKCSMTGSYLYLAGVGKLYAGASLQKTMARSTATAENRSVADVLPRADGFRFALEELGFPQGVTEILEDNEACIARSFKVVSGMKDRHEVMDHHYVRQFTQSGDFVFTHVPSEEMIADLFTKALSVGQFEYFRDLILDGTAV
jgi:hypothetical protein